jgi:hypothetical protein
MIMAKRGRKQSKRKKPAPRQRRSVGRSSVTDAHISLPGAASLFRFCFLDPESSGLIERAASWLKPFIGTRDRDALTRIKRANSAEEVIDLVPLAGGLGEPAWQERVRQFGLEAVPLISQRLAALHQTREKELRHMMLEKLIGALRWQSDAGARVLLERFDGLDDYGRSLACVVLGLLGERSAADELWHFYRRVIHNRRESHFVGALWGLIDLGDERVGEALADLLGQGRDFYELYGFLSLAGDARVIAPLLSRLARESRENEQAAMALVSIAHRIGRDAFMAELGKVVTSEEPVQERETFVERFFSVPESRAREYFGWFYRGLTSEDLARAFSAGTQAET